MRQGMVGSARASRMFLSLAWHAHAHASIANRQEMQAIQCKKAMQQFAHGCGTMAAELRAVSDAMEAGASTSASQKARRALGVAQEGLGGEESKESAHGNTPFLSAPPRSQAFQNWVERMKMHLL